jgi:hypothetical protein
MHTRFSPRARIVALSASIATVICSTLASLADPAAASGETLSQVVIESPSSTLALSFDSPISASAAAGVVEKLTAPNDAVSGSRPSVALRNETEFAIRAGATLAATTSRPPLGCGNQRVNTDSNGRFTIDYRCDLSPKRLQWSYKLSTAVQGIVVGTVNEQGARWWKDGASMLQNVPHVVGAAYTFHGTFNPVAIGSNVDYQDYMSFRHNVGPGGTASVTWAGSALTTKALP